MFIDLQLGIQHLGQLRAKGNDAGVHNEESRQNQLGLLDIHLVV